MALAKKNRTFENAMKLTIDVALTAGAIMLVDADHELLDAAGQLDDLEHRIANDAEDMAQRFELFANQVREGYVRSLTLPTGYSTLRDIDANKAKFDAKIDSLFALVGCVFGKDVKAAYREALKAERDRAFKAHRDAMKGVE